MEKIGAAIGNYARSESDDSVSQGATQTPVHEDEKHLPDRREKRIEGRLDRSVFKPQRSIS